MVAQPRQTRLKLFFTAADKDVSEDIMPDIISFTYDDKETNESDEISLTLKDPDGKWAGSWKPEGGESIRAYIVPGTTQQNYKQLYCGRFYVDTLRAAGSPRTCELSAVSIPLNKPIRKKLKSRAWEKTTLKGIAQQICEEAGIKLMYDSELNPSYDRQDQKQESDLKFLSRLCEEETLSLKVTDSKVVIFSQESYENKKAVATLKLGEANILSWDFESTQSEQYKSVTVKYRDPKKKVEGSAGGKVIGLTAVKERKKKEGENPAVLSYTYTDETVGEEGQEYALKKRATSLDDAKRLAKAKLRSLNMRHITGSMSVVGDVSLVAGVVIECKGFGSFDGNFIVEQATHTVDSSGGYKTDLTLRRVNNAY